MFKLAPLFELGVHHSAGKSLPADPDAFEHAVTLQLVQHQVRVQLN